MKTPKRVLIALVYGAWPVLLMIFAAHVCSAQTQDVARISTNTNMSPPEQRLLLVRRIFVDSFGEDPISRQMQEMVMDAFIQTGRFVVTENREKADAILKGTAVEKRSQELHSFSESTDVAQSAAKASSTLHGSSSGSLRGSSSGSLHGSSSGSLYGSSVGSAISSAIGIDDSQTTVETIDDARVTVRLVNQEGDVLWSTVQESTGAKRKGASADAANKVAKQLLRDIQRIERKATP